MKNLVSQYQADIGLSGGYDSRLLFLLCRDAGFPVSLHSHLTAGTHETELRVAETIAKMRGARLRVVRTRRVENLEESEVERMLLENLYYFDGRNTHSMGAFSETYTRSYKVATIGEARVSLNGKAGEIYRNCYTTARDGVDFGGWMRNHVYYSIAKSALRATHAWRTLHEHIIRKMEARLNVDLTGSTDLLTTRRYYGEIRSPDCYGSIDDAHNQVAFHLTPFIDYSILQTAYEATSYLGASGAFEAAMMTTLDAEIAGLHSTHGYSLTHEPFAHRLHCLIKAALPERFWVWRTECTIRRSDLGMAALRTYPALRERSGMIRRAEEALCAFAPLVDWHMLMRVPESRATALFVGTFLCEFGGKLRPFRNGGRE
jgi:hypothetical protein